MVQPSHTQADSIAELPPSNPRRRRGQRLAIGLALVLAGGAAGLAPAWAHGNLVRGSVTVAPDPPRPGQAMVITVDLAKTNDSPVEGATLTAELTTAQNSAPPAGAVASGGSAATAPATSAAGTGGAAAPRGQSFPLQEYREPYGTYRAQLTAPPAGRYTLTVHDRTQPGEDSVAQLPLRIGGNMANGSRGFTFAGAAGGSNSLRSWLLWLVALPLVVGVVVTVLVRRSAALEAVPDRATGDLDGAGERGSDRGRGE